MADTFDIRDEKDPSEIVASAYISTSTGLITAHIDDVLTAREAIRTGMALAQLGFEVLERETKAVPRG